MCWLVNNHGGEDSALVAATLPHSPVWAGWTPQPHSLHTAAWCETWANWPPGERLSLATQTDWGPWVWSGWGGGHCQCALRRPRRSMPQFVSQPSKSAPPAPHCSLALDLGQTGPGRKLPQRQPGFLVAAWPSQFLQPQHPDPQPQPTPHHSLAPDRGWTQQGKGHNPELRLSRAVDAYKGGAQVLWMHGPHLLQQSPPLGQGIH